MSNVLIVDKLTEEMFSIDDDELGNFYISDNFVGAYKGLDLSHDPMYCNCKSPILVKSSALGEVFDYCRACKKERL